MIKKLKDITLIEQKKLCIYIQRKNKGLSMVCKGCPLENTNVCFCSPSDYDYATLNKYLDIKENKDE